MKADKRYSLYPVCEQSLKCLPFNWWFKRTLEDMNRRPYYRINQVGKVWTSTIWNEKGTINLARRRRGILTAVSTMVS